MQSLHRERVTLESLQDCLQGMLFLPPLPGRLSAVLIAHGAGDHKENFFEIAEYLGQHGIASLVIDLHGHGESGGTRYHVEMSEWVPDVRAGLDFLCAHARIDSECLGAFGLSSGGTAVIEAALVDTRIKALVLLDATVRNSLPIPMSMSLRFLNLIGALKRQFTSRDLHLSLVRLSGGLHLASDPEVNRQLLADERALEPFKAFPFPGAAQAFFVDTINRVGSLQAPTLILWGAEDQLDSPETARLLYSKLTCKKGLHIIAGNGHVGHLDRHKEKVFALTCEWLLEHLHGRTLSAHEPEQPVTP